MTSELFKEVLEFIGREIAREEDESIDIKRNGKIWVFWIAMGITLFHVGIWTIGLMNMLKG